MVLTKSDLRVTWRFLNGWGKLRVWLKGGTVSNKAHLTWCMFSPLVFDGHTCSCDTNAQSRAHRNSGLAKLHWFDSFLSTGLQLGRHKRWDMAPSCSKNPVTHRGLLRPVIVRVSMHVHLHTVCSCVWSSVSSALVWVCETKRLWGTLCPMFWKGCQEHLAVMCYYVDHSPAVVAIKLVVIMLISVVMIIWVSMAAATGCITGPQSSGHIWKPWLPYKYNK